jgi:hypothetical protein
VASSGFTVLEVILAIVIAAGILVAALHFYRQAADLRARLLEEADRLTTIRLILDRMTWDLRTAFAQPQEGFTGSSAAMRFVKSDLPQRAAWATGPFGRLTSAETDLKLITYHAATALEGTNLIVTGLARTEGPLVEWRSLAALRAVAGHEVEPAQATNRVDEPLTDAVRFVHFRYWDGLKWADSWDGTTLPLGVEVNFGIEVLPDDATPEEYPYEVFRRVICLPSGSAWSEDFP